MVVFSAFLGRIAGVGASDVPYPLFALAGLVPWTLFSQSLIGASNSLVNNHSLILKVYFPRLLLPLSGVASYLIDFVVATGLLFVAMVLFWHAPPLTFLLAPVFGGLAVLAALAVGLWLAAINVRYRDVKYALPFLVQVWLFASPVAYSSVPVESILVSIAATLTTLLGGLAYFRRVERTFADTI
jgi:lipopolysaccharide transport system permease protein